ncbi:uncharacterized protein [Littorina saxatilis]|uniref:Uncharacterized protein n=1 Tax=Littorina saxatilis TaxID=31220 RepID=A0AAN9AWK3_9CAEN
MGVLDVPRKLVHSYLRVVGLTMLIAYSLVQRAWLALRPSLSPIFNIHDTIDPDTVTVNSVLQQLVKVVLLVGVMYWRLLQAVWDTVTSPFKAQLTAVQNFFEGLSAEYQEVTHTKLT